MCVQVVSGVLHEMDGVTWQWNEVMGWATLLLDHGEEVGNGNVECTWCGQ